MLFVPSTGMYTTYLRPKVAMRVLLGTHIARCTFVSTMINSASKSTILLWNFGGSFFYLEVCLPLSFHHTCATIIHIYLCFTELNMLFVYTLYQCSFILCLSLHIVVPTVNCCFVQQCHMSHACRYSAFVLCFV